MTTLENPRPVLLANLPTSVFACVALALWLSAGLAYYFSSSKFTDSLFIGSDNREQIRAWPFVMSNPPNKTARFIVPVDFPLFHPSIFSFYGSGQLQELVVNGTAVPIPFPAQSVGDYPLTLDLSKELHPGVNKMEFSILSKSDVVTVRLHPSLRDPLRSLAVVLALLGTAAALAWAARRWSWPLSVTVILFAGIAFRVIYCTATPYHIRDNDFWGHLPYIKYVLEHFALPSASWGWQSYQPPLYYLLCGLWPILTGQLSSPWLYEQWQLFALALSISSLIVCWPIARSVFTGSSAEEQQCIFLAVLAVFPGLVYHSSRINNDSLLTALAFFWFYSLTVWWNRPSAKTAGWVGIVLSLALLTKSNSVPLLAITGICFLSKAGTSPMLRLTSCASLGAVCLVLAGWYHLPRFAAAAESSSFLVGNWQFLQDSLRIEPSLGHFTAFSPLSILQHPFNNTPGIHRDAFLGYFFRTALFGEWWQPFLMYLPARTLAVAMMICLPLCLWGLFHSIASRFNAHLPFLATLVIISASMIMFTIKLPFACSQDFRYISILILPIAFYVAMGASRSTIGRILVASLIFTSSFYVFFLSLAP